MNTTLTRSTFFIFSLLIFGITFFIPGTVREVGAWDDPGTCFKDYSYCYTSFSGVFCGDSQCDYSCEYHPQPSDYCPSECTFASQCDDDDDDDDDDREYQTLRVQKDGTGTGTVTSSPSGINCGSTCQVTSESTNRWDLTASPASGSTFDGWSIGQYNYNGAPCITYGGKNNSCTEWTQIPTCGTLSQCRVSVSSGRTTTITATFGAPPPPTLTASLAVTPTSGTTDTTFNFTTTVGGTATGTISYSKPQCGTGGTLSNWSGSSDNTFSCRYSSTGTKTASATVSRGGLTATATRSLIVSLPAPTLTGSLTASPTSGEVNDTFTFTATRTGGTATGTVTYTSPMCTNGTLVTGSYSGTSDRTFQCRYSTPSRSLWDTRGARMTINQGGATTIVSRNVTVTSPSFYVSLAASPTTGTVNTTTFNFTPTAHNVPPASTWGSYSVSYSSPTCGSGASPTNFSSLTGTFRCLYSTTGIKGVSVVGTARRRFSPTLSGVGTRSVTVGSAATVTASLSASPNSIIRGGSSTLTWSSSNATSCSGSNFNTDGSTSGTSVVSPTSDTNYGVTCTGPGGSTTRTALVRVSEPAITAVNVDVDPTWIAKGSSTTVSWETVPSNPGSSTRCRLDGGAWIPYSPLGSNETTISGIQQATQFSVFCENAAPSSASGTATVYVLPSFGEF
jgi:hypothetical protein